MVVCNIRVNPLGWPLAIASSLLYFALFWNSRLYGEASLQIFFAVVALLGLVAVAARHAGRRLGAARARPGRARTRRGRRAAARRLAGDWVSSSSTLTDTDVPWWDAFPTAASVLGQWLLGRKYVENWPTWVVVNAVSIGLFAYKGLWLTVLLYAIFVAMSLAGWRAWKRIAVARMKPGFVVAIVGAESTGKSTLAADLCAALRAEGRDAACVSEYLREFCDRLRRTPAQAEQARHRRRADTPHRRRRGRARSGDRRHHAR